MRIFWIFLLYALSIGLGLLSGYALQGGYLAAALFFCTACVGLFFLAEVVRERIR